MKKITKKIIASCIITTSVVINLNAQIALTKTLPPVGTKYCHKFFFTNDLYIKNNQPQTGLNQTWDYSVADFSLFSQIANYEVIPSDSIDPTSLSATPGANFFTKNSNGTITNYWLYKESNDSLKIMSSVTSGSLSPNTPPPLEFKFNIPYLSNVIFGTTTQYSYAGTGTLKLGALTFSNVALFKQVVSPGNAISYQFFQVSPFYHRIAMMTYDSSPYVILNAYVPDCNLGSTGINEFALSSITSVYPNPTSGLLNIETKEIIDVKIVNLMGEVVRSFKLKQGSNAINVSNLTKGIYFVQSKNGGSVKFIKE